MLREYQLIICLDFGLKCFVLLHLARSVYCTFTLQIILIVTTPFFDPDCRGCTKMHFF